MKTKQTGQLLFWMGLIIIFWSVGGIGGLLATLGIALMMYTMITGNKQNTVKDKQLLFMIIIIIFLVLILESAGVFTCIGYWINDWIYGG